jgi:hypothetical protein
LWYIQVKLNNVSEYHSNNYEINCSMNSAIGGKIVQGVSAGIIISITLIVFLEIFRSIRRIIDSSREIDVLKRKVDSIEEFLKNQNK